jgi:lipid-binding SYLF domain-containing protein
MLKSRYSLATAALACTCLFAGAALAQTHTPTTNHNNATQANASVNANTGNEAQSAQQLVNDATQTVAKIKADSRFDGYLKQAKGVFIIPTLVQGAFIVGGGGAQGVLLKHNSDGTWSDPAFMSIGSISIGAQVGGKAGPAAMILMTNKALNDFTQANNFSLNGNAGLTIIGYSAAGQAPVGKGDIIVWSDQSGAFAGVSISGADLTQNTTQDHQYYGKNVNATEIINGKAHVVKAEALRNALPT